MDRRIVPISNSPVIWIQPPADHEARTCEKHGASRRILARNSAPRYRGLAAGREEDRLCDRWCAVGGPGSSGGLSDLRPGFLRRSRVSALLDELETHEWEGEILVALARLSTIAEHQSRFTDLVPVNLHVASVPRTRSPLN
jgi:hypothetical protein